MFCVLKLFECVLNPFECVLKPFECVLKLFKCVLKLIECVIVGVYELLESNFTGEDGRVHLNVRVEKELGDSSIQATVFTR